jgi:plastocyanin
MVDVSDDRHVAEVVSGLHGEQTRLTVGFGAARIVKALVGIVRVCSHHPSSSYSAAMSQRLSVALVAASVFLLAACGDSGGGDAPTGPLVEGVTVDVDAPDNFFRPEAIEVEAGTEVVWTNTGRNDHNVILSDSKEVLVETKDFAPTDVGSFRFTEVGTFGYYCSIHGTPDVGMIGVVEVVPPKESPA